MNYKFIQPVSMRVTEEQYERDLREPLLAMGYKECAINLYKKELDYLITNHSNNNGSLTNLGKEHLNLNARYFIPDYNPEFFLAIAAMTDKETPIVGEWLVCTEGSSLFGYKIGQVVQNQNPKLQLGHYHRKATLQELIEKFTNKETIKESAMKIEVIKPQEEVKWNFPCKGVGNKSGLVVGFTEEGCGCVLEKGQTNYKLYSYERFWDMDTFVPIKEKGNNYNWSNPTFPILVKGKGKIYLLSIYLMRRMIQWR